MKRLQNIFTKVHFGQGGGSSAQFFNGNLFTGK